MKIRLLTVATFATFALLPIVTSAATPELLKGYSQQAFRLPAEAELLLVADADHDGLGDILVLQDNEISIYFQDAGGFDFGTAQQQLLLNGNSVGWDISFNYQSPQQGMSIIALMDGNRVDAWHFQGRSIIGPETLHSGLNGFLGQGVTRLHFSRDINADGLDDLVIPGAGTLNLSIRNPDGSYQSAISVESEVQLNTSLNPGQLERQTGQALVIPLMELRDVNADGFADLISSTEDKLDVFLANQDGARYFQQIPSYSLDIAAIREELGEFDIDSLDFSNLTGVLALTHEEILEDINGDGISDLLLREGGKVSLFNGTATGMDFDQPAQVLRSGGNVLSTFLYDENEDGLKDLWLWRVEPISVGDVFLWLAVSGSVAVEAFIYPNEGDRFARRPARKVTVQLKFPSVIRLATSVLEITREVREAGNAAPVTYRTANLDADPSRQDLLVMIQNNIEIFLNGIEPEPENEQFLAGLGYTRNRNEYTIDVRSIIDTMSVNGKYNLEQLKSRGADFQITLDQAVNNGDIIAVEFNGDQKDDLIVFLQHSSSDIEGLLLISQGL